MTSTDTITPIRITCPECGVDPGRPCIGKYALHPARREAAYKAAYGSVAGPVAGNAPGHPEPAS